MPEPEATDDRSRVMTAVAQFMTRSSMVYAVGMAGVLPLGMLSLAVTTRYLDTADFGRLSILFAISSLLTIIGGLGFLHGAMLAAYGTAVDDDGDSDADGLDDGGGEDLVDEGARETGRERRRLLGSGTLIVAFNSAVVCALVALAAPLAARWIFGHADYTQPLRWMAASAFTGSVWRLTHQIYRLERRALTWSALQWVRPIIVVGLTLPALAAGFGVSGALAASALGTAVSIVVAVLVSNELYIFEPRRGDVGRIWAKGKPYVALNIASATQGNVSVLLLGAVAPAASVGAFQVASRLGTIPIFFAEGFVAGWAPAERSAIAMAGKDRKGTAEYQASLFSLMYLGTLVMVVLVSLLAGVLARLVAPGYEGAAALVPILAAGHGAHAIFRGVYRATSFARKRWWLMALQLVWIAPYAAVAVVLVPVDAPRGVAAAQIVAGIVVSLGLLRLARTRGETTPFHWRRLAVATAIGVGCIVLARVVPGGEPERTIATVAAGLAFGPLLVLSRVLTRPQVVMVVSILRGLLPHRLRASVVRRRLDEIGVEERRALALVVWDEVDVGEAARREGVDEDVLTARVARGVRGVAGIDETTAVDHLLGRHIAFRGTTLERDLHAEEIRRAGVDSLHIHVMDDALKLVAASSTRRTARRATAASG